MTNNTKTTRTPTNMPALILTVAGVVMILVLGISGRPIGAALGYLTFLVGLSLQIVLASIRKTQE